MSKNIISLCLLCALSGTAIAMENGTINLESTKPTTLRFLCIGDAVGQPGLRLVQHWLPIIKEEYQIDAVIVNGENSMKSGIGISSENVDFFNECGVLAITSGNHIWNNKNIQSTLQQRNNLLRPANYSSDCPGKGYGIFNVEGHPVAVVNLMGRFFFNDPLDCPFRTAESIVTSLKEKTNIILIDFHAEASFEKSALAFFLDGKVSALFGTHTHIQTADNQILPKGTAFITDLGSCCSLHSVVGFNRKGSITAFLCNPAIGNLEVETQGPWVFSGICVEIDVQTGKALQIERIRIIDEQYSEMEG